MFGRSSGPLPPIDGVESFDPKHRAAQLQHLVANAVREEILALGESVEQHVASIEFDLPGLSYDRVIRMLRGKTQMQLADVMFWAGRFDRVREVVVREVSRSSETPS